MGSMGWGYVAVMAGVTFATRALPATLIRRRVTNRFLRSFLYYVPYVTLAVMTFPAILGATACPRPAPSPFSWASSSHGGAPGCLWSRARAAPPCSR